MENKTIKKFEDLIGEILKRIDVSDNEIIVELEDGTEFEMSHGQDCCENVYVEDVCGDIKDVIGSPLVMAEEIINDNENPRGIKVPEFQESFTWTFYKLGTVNGDITIRWYGGSNGYYSESVDFFRVGEDRWDWK